MELRLWLMDGDGKHYRFDLMGNEEQARYICCSCTVGTYSRSL